MSAKPANTGNYVKQYRVKRKKLTILNGRKRDHIRNRGFVQQYNRRQFVGIVSRFALKSI